MAVPDQIGRRRHGTQTAANKIRPAAAVIPIAYQRRVNGLLSLLFPSALYLLKFFYRDQHSASCSCRPKNTGRPFAHSHIDPFLSFT